MLSEFHVVEPRAFILHCSPLILLAIVKQQYTFILKIETN